MANKVTYKDRNALGKSPDVRSAVRAKAFAYAYGLQTADVPAPPADTVEARKVYAKDLARREFAARILQARDTLITDQLATLLAARVPDAMVADGVLSDEELNEMFPLAFDAIASISTTVMRTE